MRADLEEAFHPGSIAVVGASNNPISSGYRFLEWLNSQHYPGKIYPVTPAWEEVLGLKAYPSVRDIPGPVDYVISCLPSTKLLDLVADCGAKGVKFIHSFTARFAETGRREAIELERRVLEEVRKSGARLIGPNCMGIYCPAGGMAFNDAPTEPGRIGAFSQSGGNAGELIINGAQRGLRFSKVISYGNALDLNEVDFLEYLTDDPATDIIAAYVEGPKQGKAFFEKLRLATAKKPVIILKGGRGEAGAGATSSHTAALAGSYRVWQAAMRQAGVIEAETLEELFDILVAFYFLPPIAGNRVGVAGGGGGKSVLSADGWEQGGFVLPPLPEGVTDYIKSVLPELWWDWLRNPLDISIMPMEQRQVGFNINILRLMAQSDQFDFLAVNVTAGGLLNRQDQVNQAGKDIEEIIDIARLKAKPILAIVNPGALITKDLDDVRTIGLIDLNSSLITAGIAVFRSPKEAASALFKMADYYRKRREMGQPASPSRRYRSA